MIHFVDPTALNKPAPAPPIKGHAKVVSEGPAGTISGHVYDARDGEPLIGASVLVWGTERGAATGVHGEYTVNRIAFGTYELYASYLGYRDVKSKITLDSLAGVRVDFWLAVTQIRLGPVD